MPEKGKTFAGEVREETVAWSKDTYQLLKQAEQGKVKSYVQDSALAVLDCKETATSRETFIRLMNERGYGVDWQDSHKYITYTDLAREQAGEKACKIRDNKLEKYYNMDFGKESMEHEFERNARTAEAEQSKRAASRVKPTEPDRAGKQSAQRSVGDVERELRGRHVRHRAPRQRRTVDLENVLNCHKKFSRLMYCLQNSFLIFLLHPQPNDIIVRDVRQHFRLQSGVYLTFTAKTANRGAGFFPPRPVKHKRDVLNLFLTSGF